MARIILAALAALCAWTSALADDGAPFIDRFIGEWTSDGDAFGAPAISAMRWTKVLGGRFVRLDYRIDMRPGAEDASFFEGAAYYRATESGYTAFWADSSGNLFPIAAGRDGEALVALWGEEGGEQGRTRYELLPTTGEIEVTDWAKTEDDWRQFNKNTFARTAPAQ